MFPIDPRLKQKLDIFYTTQKIPNIIFHGSSGCGKKTIVIDFISRIYNNNRKIINENVMFINCSQGKGIKFIREELKTFAKYNIHVSTEIPFKTIVLLNADALTIDAQSALRRCIELFINTRFFIIVENKYKLLNPIISRFCSIYVPEHIIDGQVINLHKYQLMHNIGDTIVEFGGIMDEQWETIENVDEKGLVDVVNELYESGVSCMDIIGFICKRGDIYMESKILMDFNIFKKEYRCEKLLIYHLLMLIRTSNDGGKHKGADDKDKSENFF